MEKIYKLIESIIQCWKQADNVADKLDDDPTGEWSDVYDELENKAWCMEDELIQLIRDKADDVTN